MVPTPTEGTSPKARLQATVWTKGDPIPHLLWVQGEFFLSLHFS